MADEKEGPDFETRAADPAALGISLGSERLSDPRLRSVTSAYLESQNRLVESQKRLVDLQVEDLKREDSVRHWSLRVRHVSDLMKLTFELALAFIFLAIAFSIAAALWNAAHDDSLVIQAFSVPPDMAARGLTGQAVAAQFQDKLVAMQNATKSARPPESYASNWGSDIKVEIPNTGVSISELYRFLSGWLGHETHISGDVFRTANGMSVTVRAGDGASTASGNENDLDKLLQQTAEKIYLRTQPYRYAIFLEAQGSSRLADSRKILEELAATGPVRERAWAWNGIAFLDGFQGGDTAQAIRDYHQVLALAPNFALAYVNLDFNEGFHGHDQASLDAAQNAVRLLKGGGDVEMSAVARTISLPTEQSNVAAAQNDFNAALVYSKQAILLPDFGNDIEGARENIVVLNALLHDATATNRAFANLPPTNDVNSLTGRSGAKLVADYWLGHWDSVVNERRQTEAIQTTGLTSLGLNAKGIIEGISVQIWPYAATAMAMTGDFAGARALIARTPLDCYTCLRNRARIAEAAHKWDEADRWYAQATRAAPSIPLGYSEWGRMLLAEGHADAAIAKFAIAHQKGPRFADPLEYWGEALVQEGHSDLALAKFEEADKYAPNWGRLHLEWGKALLYVGHKDEARSQLDTANHLDLSAQDRAALSRFMARH